MSVAICRIVVPSPIIAGEGVPRQANSFVELGGEGCKLALRLPSTGELA